MALSLPADDRQRSAARPLALPSHLQLGLTAALAAGLYTMAALLVPLWAVALGATVEAVGLVAGAGSLLPVLLALPVGMAVGRLGAGRLLALAAALAAVAALLGPLARGVEALIAVQLVGGLGRALAWMAAQTYLVQLGGGVDGRRRAVVFSFAAMAGTLVSPFVVGAMVEWQGYAATFVALAAGYALLALSATRLPAVPAARGPAGPPSLASVYGAVAALWASAGMALILLATALRFASGSLRLAFFPVYLHELALSPLAIGLLVGFGNLVTVGGVLVAGPLLGRLGALRVLYLALPLALGALAATPLGSSVLALALLSVVWGLGMGLSLPALLHQIAESAAPEECGTAMGLRQTVNEAAALASPLALGLTSSWVGIQGGFYLVGGGLAALALVGLLLCQRGLDGGGRFKHELP